MDAARRTRLAHQSLLTVAVAAAYVFSAMSMLALAAVAQVVGVVWPGLALAAVRRLGPRAWPGIALGAFTVPLLIGLTAGEALGIAVGDTLEALIGAWLLASVAVDDALERASDVFALVLLGAGLSTLVSATVGVTTLWLHGSLAAGDIGDVWLTWWIANAIGDVVVTSLLLSWSARPAIDWSPLRWLEFAALLVVTAALGSLVFMERPGHGVGAYLHSYVVFTALIWAALRFGPRGASAAVFVVSVVAVLGTAHSHGPFVRPTQTESLLSLQCFLGIVAVSTLVLAAVARERERAIAARDEFTAIAGHELRTPLTALQLQLGALLRAETSQADPLPGGREAQLRRAVRQVDRLEQRVRSLLDVQRVGQAWAPSIIPDDVDVAALVRDLADRYREVAARAGCELEVRAHTPVRACCDSFCIEQVVTHLLTNALTFGAGKPITLTVWQHDHTVSIAVADRGIGVAKADRLRIFKRFERAVSATHYGGLGLGLYIARELLAAHGGTIRVEDTPGGGATFIAELPCTPAGDKT